MKQRVILHADLLRLMTKHRIAVPVRVGRPRPPVPPMELFVCAYDLDALLEECYSDEVCFKFDAEGGRD